MNVKYCFYLYLCLIFPSFIKIMECVNKRDASSLSSLNTCSGRWSEGETSDTSVSQLEASLAVRRE